MDAPSLVDYLDQICQQVAAGRRAARLLSERVNRFGLKESEFRLLWLLCEEDTLLDQSRLAESTASSPAQISALVEQLSQRGWICRQMAPGDRRRCLWCISDKGSRLLKRIFQSETAVESPSVVQPVGAAA